MVISGTEEEYANPNAPIRETFANAEAHTPISHLRSADEFRQHLDPSSTGVSKPQSGRIGYHNPIGGWANAALGVKRLYEKILPLGGKLVPNAAAKSLLIEDNKVKGVKCKDGRVFIGDKVILAMGSWTGPFLRENNLLPEYPQALVATGLGIGAFQLDEKDWKRYKDVPVIMAWDGSGFYCFPVSPVFPWNDIRLKFSSVGCG